MSAALPTLVVGGGLGGLATALSIARGGRPVHVVEREAAFGEIGAGLQFGPNASRALDALGVLPDLIPLAVRPEEAVMLDAHTGRRLTTLHLGDRFQRRYGYPYLVVHRGDLLRLLLDHCRAHDLVTLETGREVVDADVRDDLATVTFADGGSQSTRALVASDGLHSLLRRQVSGERPVNSGYAAYRGTLPTSQATHAVDPDAVILWVGPGIHLMQYRIRAGELCNQVAVFRSPAFAAGRAGAGEWGGAEELDAAFAGTAEPVLQAISRISTTRFWPMLDAAPLTSWTRGRLVLTGDAAHPMLQYLGQGACQALEDAVELGYRLERHGDDVPTAFREFERSRRPRTTRCQTSARPWGDVWHTGDRITRSLRDRYLAARAADDYSELDWLYAPVDAGASALANSTALPA